MRFFDALSLIVGALALSAGIALLFAGFFTLAGFSKEEYDQWKARCDEEEDEEHRRWLLQAPMQVELGRPDRLPMRWRDRADLRGLCCVGAILIVVGAAVLLLRYLLLPN